MPLGTGNDLSLSFGWGNTFLHKWIAVSSYTLSIRSACRMHMSTHAKSVSKGPVTLCVVYFVVLCIRTLHVQSDCSLGCLLRLLHSSGLLAGIQKLLRLSAFLGTSPVQPWYRRPGWPLHNMYIVSRQSLYLLDPPSAHKPSSEKPGFEPPTVYFLKADA